MARYTYKNLPPEVVRRMSEKDRRELGLEAMKQPSTDPFPPRRETGKGGLQELIRGYLAQRGVHEVGVGRTDKVSNFTNGWPDLTFCYRGVACLIEVKLPGYSPEPHQRKCQARCYKDGWQIVPACSSVEQVQYFLNELDERIDEKEKRAKERKTKP